MDVFLSDEDLRFLYLTYGSRVVTREQCDMDLAIEEMRRRPIGRGGPIRQEVRFTRTFYFLGGKVATEDVQALNPMIVREKTDRGLDLREIRAQEEWVSSSKVFWEWSGEGGSEEVSSWVIPTKLCDREVPMHFYAPVEPSKFVAQEYDPKGAAGLRSHNYS